MVMVLINGVLTCGGTIIDPLHVVTAARCLYWLPSFTAEDEGAAIVYLNTSGVEVIAGKHWYPASSPFTGEQRVNVSVAINNEKYLHDPGRYSNDIAILRLQRPLVFNGRVSALCLPQSSSSLPPQCTVAGWGVTNVTYTQPDKLVSATLTAYNRTSCLQLDSLMSTADKAQYYVNLESQLADGVMCLANITLGQQACSRDYGGPAFCLDSSGSHYELFGVISWAYTDCTAKPAFPTVLTYVPDFLPWIEQTIGHLESPCAVRPCPWTSTCRVKETSYECVCPNGWSGPLCDNCGLNLTAPQGTFNASNMMLGSYRSVNCSWTIVIPWGSTVELAFTYLSLYYNYYCSSAFIEIRQNNGSGQLLAKLCGYSSSLSAPIVSNSSLYIRFYSDSSSYSYFRAFYTVNEILSDSVRLLNGETSSQGRLQHYVDYQWVPVCGNDFDSNAASVVCRELGLSPHNATFLVRENSSSAADNRWYQCTGSENRLAQCQTTQRNCSLHNVNITCNAPECGVVRGQGPSSRIVGGAVAADGQFPWTVMVFYSGTFLCGGTIIDPLHVITAARCLSSLGSFSAIHNTSAGMTTTVQYLDTSYLQIIAGKQWYPTSIKYAGEQKVNISSAISHERYRLDSGTYSNDIAVLRLERPLTFDSKVSAICLPTTSSSMAPQCTVAGWGVTDVSGTQPDQLMWASMTVYNRTACQLLGSMAGTLAQHTMCLTNVTHGQQACYKDYGGPAFCLDSSGSRYELFGVVSWAMYEYCRNSTTIPTVITFVPDFLPWIQQAIEQLESPCARRVCSSFSQCRETANGTSYDCVCPSGWSGPLCSYCGLNLTASQGTFNSSNLFGSYRTVNCNWTIVTPMGSTVELAFTSLSLYNYNYYDCSYTFIEIRQNNASGQLLTTLCGYYSSLPAPIVSNSSLYIRFHSESSSYHNYFRAFYTINEIAFDSVRLLNGDKNSQGRLQHYVDYQWVQVCGNDFDSNDASVVCRELGLSPYNATFSVGENSSSAADNRWYQCTGSEDRLAQCQTTLRNCSLNSVNITCNAPECGVVRSQGPRSRILGGAVAADGQFPWTVMVIINGNFICGGTIIDPLHVITAASCLSSLSSFRSIRNTSTGVVTTVNYVDTSNLQIIAGKQWYPTNVKYTGEQKVNTSSAIYHDQYRLDSGQYFNDIAVLQLDRPLTFDAKVSAICLPTASSSLAPQCTVAGWGVTDESYTRPDKLMWATLTAYNRTACQMLESMTSSLAEHTMCLSNITRGQQACYQDFGGPAFCLDSSGSRYELFGVVSWASYEYYCNTRSTIPTVLTYVPDFLPWIQQAMEHLESPCARLVCSSFMQCRENINGTSYDCVCPAGLRGPLCNRCGQNLTSSVGNVTSPNYPLPYPIYANCEWTIVITAESTIVLTFIEVNLECGYDYVEVRENSASGRLLTRRCSAISPEQIVSSTSLYINFTSDGSVQYRGFKISYRVLIIAVDSVRLVGGETTSQGTLQHYVQKNWVPVCGDGFDNNSASVVCRELGFSPRNATFSVTTRSNTSADNRWYQCTGSEDSLANCSTLQRPCTLHNVFLTCSACTNNTLGLNCSERCRCVNEHTLYCDPTSGSCLCTEGWEGSICADDVNECSLSCNGSHEICNNFPGGFECSCAVGYARISTGDCADCDNNTFGHNCSGNCSCVQENTALCDKVNGTCTCKAGWAGVTCADDINECLYVCNGRQEVCTNFPGNFDCSCTEGFGRNASGFCVACANYTYGQNCSQKCTCAQENTLLCNPVNGTCHCKEGWEGVTCADDVNECNLKCNGSQELCRNLPGTFECTCANGTARNASRDCAGCTCCTTFGPNCSQICSCVQKNTLLCDPVSGSCKCKEGWAGLACADDVNECQFTCNASHEVCMNSPGGFECGCSLGFARNYSGNCVVCSNFTFGQNCSQKCSCVGEHTAECNPVNGTCHCNTGWEGTTCADDVNECLHLCNSSQEVCTNTPGNFECSCAVGYARHSGSNCVVCTNYTFGQNCSQNCNCVQEHTFTCDPINGTCNCKTGWQGVTCADDVNECNLRCSGSHEVCRNLPGGFECVCANGTARNASGDCAACAKNTFGQNCSQDCSCVQEHTLTCDPVSGTCNCKTGWQGVTCADDVNECELRCSGSHEVCRNLPGSFECACANGTARNASRDCAVCAKYTFGQNCSQDCSCVQEHTLTCDPVSGTCNCNTGWQGVTCADDVNECELRCSGSHEVCRNLPGRFECTCANGTARNASGDCAGCTGYTFGSNCSQTCSCVQENTLLCNPVSGSCKCKDGWEGSTCFDDVNECQFTCNASHEVCKNSPGGFQCICSVGYSRNVSGKCDLCAKYTFGQNCSQDCSCVQEHTLTCDPVSGTCNCKTGWQGVTCADDVNECELRCSGSHEVCRNLPGGFECTCANGSARNASGECSGCTGYTFGSNCSQTCSCVREHTLLCDPVSGSCKCKEGWEGSTCADDVNECQFMCNASHEVCKNSPGGFECSCSVGYNRSVSGKCVLCENYTFGQNCSQDCSCVQEHTLTCDPVSGTCNCKTGWQGVTCADDVNECELRCSGSHEVCRNLPGGFECACANGTSRNASGDCAVCANFTFGPNCSQECNCSRQNSLSCDAVNGSCTCKAGWDGSTCADDINECVSSICTKGQEVCSNNLGGYECACANNTARNSSGYCVATSNIPLVITVNVNLDLDWQNVTSLKLLMAQIQKELEALLVKKASGVLIVKVKNIRKGSIIVDAEVSVAQTEAVKATSVLMKDLNNMANTPMPIGNMTGSSTVQVAGTVVSNNTRPCELLKVLNLCHSSNELCEDSSGQAVCKQLQNTTPDFETWKIIVIAVVCGTGLIVALIVVVACCVCRRQSNKEASLSDNHTRQNRAESPTHSHQYAFYYPTVHDKPLYSSLYGYGKEQTPSGSTANPGTAAGQFKMPRVRLTQHPGTKRPDGTSLQLQKPHKGASHVTSPHYSERF